MQVRAVLHLLPCVLRDALHARPQRQHHPQKHAREGQGAFAAWLSAAGVAFALENNSTSRTVSSTRPGDASQGTPERSLHRWHAVHARQCRQCRALRTVCSQVRDTGFSARRNHSCCAGASTVEPQRPAYASHPGADLPTRTREPPAPQAGCVLVHVYDEGIASPPAAACPRTLLVLSHTLDTSQPLVTNAIGMYTRLEWPAEWAAAKAASALMPKTTSSINSTVCLVSRLCSNTMTHQHDTVAADAPRAAAPSPPRCGER